MNKSQINRNQKKLIAFIKTKRLENNYSQHYVASKLGIKQAAYSKLESGKQCMNVPQLIRVLELYGISMERLIN